MAAAFMAVTTKIRIPKARLAFCHTGKRSGSGRIAVSCFAQPIPKRIDISSAGLSSMKAEQPRDHARLEKLILVAALTCCAAMVYLASLSLLS
jgi:hypothetical protein